MGINKRGTRMSKLIENGDIVFDCVLNREQLEKQAFKKLEKLERIIEVEGYKIFMTHGHNYGVRYTQEYIMEAAESQGANIALYGHTHIVDYRIGPPLLLNPGSASRPRDDNRGSFIVMELQPEVEPKVTIIRLR